MPRPILYPPAAEKIPAPIAPTQPTGVAATVIPTPTAAKPAPT